MSKQPITCALSGGGTVTFDVEHSEADDVDATWTLYHLFASTVGK